MKIGIITFHCVLNYGALLQAYALQQYLIKQGHDAYIIDYKPKYFVNARDNLRFSIRHFITKDISNLPKVFLDGIRLYKKRISKFTKFQTFRENRFRLYPFDETFDGSEFDLCLLGSDQIWNKVITGGQFDKIYFGKDFKCPVISYAASTILGKTSEQEKQRFRDLLCNIKYISVRENILKDKLESIGISPVKVVLDPTLLAGGQLFWDLSKSSVWQLKEPYIVIYMVRSDANLIAYARRFSKRHNLRLVEISNGFTSLRRDIKIYDAGIEDFVSILNNAQFVITNSFHGTAVSILLQKQFVTIRQNGPIDDRVGQILLEFGLTNRFIQYSESVELPSIDYEKVNCRIDESRLESANFLNSCILRINNSI